MSAMCGSGVSSWGMAVLLAVVYGHENPWWHHSSSHMPQRARVSLVRVPTSWGLVAALSSLDMLESRLLNPGSLLRMCLLIMEIVQAVLDIAAIL